MTKGIFTTSEGSAYDDQPESRYHFPQTYLAQAREVVGDWIVYYEPRRASGPSSNTGRQAYFAMARVDRIEPDSKNEGHYYAYVDKFIEFDSPVPFREGAAFFETALRKPDGSTNRGAFGRAIRTIPEAEFALIVRAGFTADDPWDVPIHVAEPVPEYEPRPVIQQLLSRKFRDRAFVRHVRRAYNNTCAISGLSLINGGGRPEVEAAHIRPVEADGPDTVRNGIALTGTVHWMFDRGLLSISDDLKVLISPGGIPANIARLLPANGAVAAPARPEFRPHPVYLRWHRQHCFKG